MKRTLMVILVAAMALALGGCTKAIKVEKFSQAQIASDPKLRAASPVELFNRYEATCVQVFVFRGALSNEEMYIWAQGKRLIIITDRLATKKEIWLEPAFSDRDPAKKSLLFAHNKTFTILGIIRGGGRAIDGPLYRIEKHVVHTTKNPLRDTRNGLERVGTTAANRIVEFGGTNRPVLDKLTISIFFYPNQKVRDWMKR